MACEQATRRGGLVNITDSMWLVLAFQGWYVADGLYNEVRHSFVSSFAYGEYYTLIARCLHYHGYYDGRFWLHAFCR